MATITGNGGDNVLVGTTLGPLVPDDRDRMYGLDGDDTLIGGGGADILDGGDDFDFASYETAPGAVIANLASPGMNTGHAAGDKYVSIEGLIGSRYNDRLTGDNNDNIIDGRGGNDTIDTGAGNDVVREGGGNDSIRGGTDTFDGSDPFDPFDGQGDILEYAGHADIKYGIVADLETGEVEELGFGTTDNTSGFEGIRGTQYGDDIRGSEGHDSVLDGRDGSDFIDGRGGNDWVIGGAGADTVSGGAGEDVVLGGTGNDTLSGGTGDDVIEGRENTDTVSYAYVSAADEDGMGLVLFLSQMGNGGENAGSGNASSGANSSVFNGTADDDIIFSVENAIGTQFNDFMVGNSNGNELDGAGGNDTLYAGQASTANVADVDTLRGGSGDDTLIGFAGGDYLFGGTGSDTADYRSAPAGLTVSLADATLNTGEAAGDTFDSIENIQGSGYADTLAGDSDANILSGGRGNDTLLGSGGWDTMVGGLGADHFHGGSGEDTVDYSREIEGLTQNVVVDLVNQTQNSGRAAGDTFEYVERVVGTEHDDVFRGNNGLVNRFYGGEGDDTFRGRGGMDALDGGDGDDLAIFSGNLSDYSFRVLHTNDTPWVYFLEVTHDVANGDGVDYVLRIERMQFLDQTVFVSDFL